MNTNMDEMVCARGPGENMLLQQKVERPKWLSPSGNILEYEFCQELLMENRLCSVNGTFYTLDGTVRDLRVIRQIIYDKLSQYISSGFSKKVESILYTLRLQSDDPEALLTDINFLHLANGIYSLDDGVFFGMKRFCRYRLPVNYNADAPKPQRWLAFLRDLLEEEDILTLQEYMGYCLVPSTRAQKMLMIIGSGGEGKSRIGVVMKGLLGDSMYQGSLSKIEHSPFARACLENMLVMVDDDMQMEALKQTGYLKSIITADGPMDLERKGEQSYQGRLFVRFLAFGNGSLRSLHDRSYGFFRRQIILRAKPRPADRVDDPFLDLDMLEEKEGILLWCLEGYRRLYQNNYRFTLSAGSRKNVEEAMAAGCNVMEFMHSQGYFLLDSAYSASTRSLYAVYRDWCDDNSLSPLSATSFSQWLKENCGTWNLAYDRSVPIGSGKYARGFKGIRTLPRI